MCIRDRGSPDHMSTDFDVIIRGGLVIDGTGSPGFESDIGIKGDTIAAIADLKNAKALSLIHI